MLTKFLLAVLNGILTYGAMLIIAIVLGMVGLGSIGAIFSDGAWAVAVLVGILTFLGAIPSLWNSNIIK